MARRCHRGFSLAWMWHNFQNKSHACLSHFWPRLEPRWLFGSSHRHKVTQEELVCDWAQQILFQRGCQFLRAFADRLRPGSPLSAIVPAGTAATTALAPALVPQPLRTATGLRPEGRRLRGPRPCLPANRVIGPPRENRRARLGASCRSRLRR